MSHYSFKISAVKDSEQKQLQLWQIKVRLLKIITNSSPNSLLPRSSTPCFLSFLPPPPSLPLFLHPAPGHVLFIGISPQSAVLIVHLCRSRGAVCNMAPVIICAHCVPVLKNILQTHMGPAVDHHSTEANCCCGHLKLKINSSNFIDRQDLTSLYCRANFHVYTKTDDFKASTVSPPKIKYDIYKPSACLEFGCINLTSCFCFLHVQILLNLFDYHTH